MPEKKTTEKAHQDKREGKSASTQAGEYVHEEIEHVREGKHGARSAKQAIAIGLSKARRDGVKLAPPKKGAASEATRKRAKSDEKAGEKGKKKVSSTRSKASSSALKKEGRSAASPKALSKQAHSAASKRSASARSASAEKAAKTKGAAGRSEAAKKAARTRAKKSS
jgi:hypothetical protein